MHATCTSIACGRHLTCRARAQAWLRTEVDSLLSERPQQGAAGSARTAAAARRVRQVVVDAADEEERELRRLEGGTPAAGGGGGGGGKLEGGALPPVTPADVDSVLAFYADPKVGGAGDARRRSRRGVRSGSTTSSPWPW